MAFIALLKKQLSLLLFFVPTSILTISLTIFLLTFNGFSLAIFRVSNIASIPYAVSPTLDRVSLIHAINEEITQAIKPKLHNTVGLSYTPPLPNKREVRRRIKSMRRLKFLQPDNRSLTFASRATKFLNSSCSTNFFMTWISPLDSFGKREFFSIETLFKLHRDACLLLVSNTMDSPQGRNLLHPFEIQGFKVLALSPNYPYIFKDTPAEIWFAKLRNGETDPGEIPIGQNLSNLLRHALLYIYGGVYVDTDVVFLKSFLGLKNAIGVQAVDPETGNWTRLNNAVMVFDMNHPLLYSFMEEFAQTFDGNRWGYNGPYLVSRVVSRMIEKEGVEFTILPQEIFYPVNWNNIEKLFREPKDDGDSKWMKAKVRQIEKKSHALHLWNRQSRMLQIGKSSVLEKIMMKHCIFCNSSMHVM